METRKPNIVLHGPVAEHDQSCAVFFHQHPAVLDLSTGVFRPSWAAQKQGWQLVQADTWWRRWVLRVAFNGGADAK